MAITIKERRERLTQEVVKAREHYHATVRLVSSAIEKANPTMEWWQKQAKVEEDQRVRLANERLLALCDAANIMGAEIA